MSKKKNKKNHKGNGFATALTTELETKGNGTNSAVETLKDLVVGAVGGGLAGAAIGKNSLLFGIGTSLIGHYAGSSLATSFGLGMMASGGYQMASGAVNGKSASGLEGVKERVKAFGANFKQRLYLDKIIKSKVPEKEDSTDGLGNVQYFKYPENQELDMGSLEQIERAISRSGEQFQRRMAANDVDLSGLSEERIL